MAYCTVKEALDQIKEDMQNVVIGDEYIEDAQEKTEKIQAIAQEAVEDAAAEIDGYLAKRYSVPFENPSRVLNKFCKDIAVYNIVSRAGIDESSSAKTYLTRYQSAVRFLENVAKGIIDIGMEGANSTASSASTGFQLNSSRRLFRRENMKGW